MLKAVGEQRRARRGIRGQRSRAGATGVAGGAGCRANRRTDGSKSRAEKRRRAWQGARTAQLNDRDVRSESTPRPVAASTATCPRTRSTTPVVGDHQPLQISRDMPLLYWCSLAAMAATASTALITFSMPLSEAVGASSPYEEGVLSLCSVASHNLPHVLQLAA